MFARVSKYICLVAFSLVGMCAVAAREAVVINNYCERLPFVGADNRIALVMLGKGDRDALHTSLNRYSKVDIVDASVSEFKRYDHILVALTDTERSTILKYSEIALAEGIIPLLFVEESERMVYAEWLAGCDVAVVAPDNTKESYDIVSQLIFGGVSSSANLRKGIGCFAHKGEGVHYPKSRLGYAKAESVGLDASMGSRLDSIVARCIEQRAFPGCQLLIAKDGYIVFEKAYGTRNFSGDGAVTLNTIYDLASVSKVTGTLPGVMKAYDEGLLNIDDSLATYIPELTDTLKRKLTLRELLYHESGMPPSLSAEKYYIDHTSYEGELTKCESDSIYTVALSPRRFMHRAARLRSDIFSQTPFEGAVEAAEGIYVGKAARDTIMQAIYDIPLRSKDYVYSCLNLSLMMDVEERVTHERHDKWVEEQIFAPLGMERTQYRPLERWRRDEIAPTEEDMVYRKQHLCGHTHDELAAFSGNVQGNAGLFSTASDIAKLCQMWLNGGVYGGVRVLSEECVALFTTSKSPTCRRGLGFDKPNVEDVSASPTTPEASASTYGHQGYTGTVFWVDARHNLIYIFLSNRVNPTRHNSAFAELSPRTALHQVVYQSLIKNNNK